MGSSRQLPIPAAGRGPFAEILAAIDDEIEAVERDAGGSFDVSDGRRLHRGIGGSLYTFRGELEIPLPPETPIGLHARGDRHRGTLVGVDDFDVLVHLRDDAGESVPTATISSQPAFILDKLRERLTGLAAGDPAGLPTAGVARSLVDADSRPSRSGDETARQAAAELERLDDPALRPNPSQLRAMARVHGSDLHFVWGPPGTGKTANLAQIARMLVASGERVLILAHANVAVDVAMLGVADAFRDRGELAGGRVLRVGDPRHPDALGREEILVDGVLRRRFPDLARRRAESEQRRRELASALRSAGDDTLRDELAADLRRVREELTAVRAQYRDVAESLIRDAAVVGATLSRFALSDALWEWQPDAVLVDEASMVSFPWVLAAATRAGKRLVVLGDFRQLPPVQVARTDPARRWLGRDAYDVAGVRERVDAGVEDERVTLLETQFRMGEPIARAVSDLAYGGRLRTDGEAASRAERLAEREPWPGSSLVLVDTALLAPSCQVEGRPGSFSRLNPLHLLLGVSLACAAGDTKALISPYRAQARLLAAAARDLQLPEAGAATIHRFQGSERDVVVLDLVDAPPIGTPSRLTGSDVDLSLRLTNVGLSRAKGKAIVVADREFVESRFAPGAPVRRALDLCAEHGRVVQPAPSDVAQELSRHGIEWFDGWDRLGQRLAADVEGARRSLVVNTPPGIELPDAVVDGVAAASERGVDSLVLGSPAAVAALEQSAAVLRLLARPGFLVLVDHVVAYVGGRAVDAVARVHAPTLVPILEAAVLGPAVEDASLRRPAPRRALPRT